MNRAPTESTPLSEPKIPRRICITELGKYYGFRYFHVQLLLTVPLAIVTGCTLQGVSPFLVDAIQDEYGTDNAWVSFAHTGVLLGSLPGIILFGAISDRYGRKFTLMVSVAYIALLSILCLLLPSGEAGFPLLVGLRIMLGVPYGGVFTTAPAFVIEFVPDESRGAVLVLFGFAWIIGAAYSILVVAVLGDEQWRLCFAMAPALPAASFIIAVSMLPESPRQLLVTGANAEAKEALDVIFASPPAYGEAYVGKPPEVTLEAGGDADSCKSYQDVAKELCSPALMRITLISICLTSILSGLGNAENAWGPRILKKIAGEKPGLEVYAYSYLVMGGACILVAVCTDRIGRLPFLQAGYAGIACVFVGLAATTSLAPACILWNVRAIPDAFMNSTLHLWIMEVFPTALRVRALGLVSVCARILSVLTPLILGAMFGEIHIRWIMIGFSGIYFIGFVVSLQIPYETARLGLPDSTPTQLA